MFSQDEMRAAVSEKIKTDPAYAALAAAVGQLTQAGQALEERVETIAFLTDTLDSKINGVALDVAVSQGKVQ